MDPEIQKAVGALEVLGSEQQSTVFRDSISPNPADEFSTRGPCQTCESWVLGGGIAKAYLDPLDHFVKHELRVQGYVRYLDD